MGGYTVERSPTMTSVDNRVLIEGPAVGGAEPPVRSIIRPVSQPRP